MIRTSQFKRQKSNGAIKFPDNQPIMIGCGIKCLAPKSRVQWLDGMPEPLAPKSRVQWSGGLA
jgi:hypothetical protein